MVKMEIEKARPLFFSFLFVVLAGAIGIIAGQTPFVGLGAAALGLCFALATRSVSLLYVAIPIALVVPFLHYSPVPGAPALSLSDVALAAMLIFGFLLVTRSARNAANPLDVPVVAFFIANFLSLLTSANLNMSLRALFQLTLAVGVYFLFSRIREERHFRAVLVSVAIVVTTGTAIALAQYLTNDPLFMTEYLNEVQQQERITFGQMASSKSISFFGHGNSFALLLTMCVPLMLGLLHNTKRGLLVISLIAFGVFGDLSTFSRGGLFALMVGLATFFILARKGGSRGWGVTLVPLLLFGGIVLNESGMLTVFLERFTESDYALRDSGSNLSRLVSIQAAINAFMAYPLTGIGIGTSGTHFVFFGGFTDLGPHNMFLLIASERGFFALVAFVILVGTAIQVGWKGIRSRRDIMGIAFLASWVSLLVHGLFESVLVDIFQYFAFMVLGLLVARTRFIEQVNIVEEFKSDAT